MCDELFRYTGVNMKCTMDPINTQFQRVFAIIVSY